MKRMPQDALSDVLETMDMHRSSKLRRLRRRITTAKAAA
jgi:hypothetical protein